MALEPADLERIFAIAQAEAETACDAGIGAVSIRNGDAKAHRARLVLLAAMNDYLGDGDAVINAFVERMIYKRKADARRDLKRVQTEREQRPSMRHDIARVLESVSYLEQQKTYPPTREKGTARSDAHKRKKLDDTEAHNRQRESSRRRRAQVSKTARDIPKISHIAYPKRRAMCRLSFQYFCEQYFSQAFTKPWSQAHLKAISKIESAVLDGELFAFAMPRGDGKTTLIETAGLWAQLYGHCPFIVIIGADKDAAAEMLASIKTELTTNEALADDFPEVVEPIIALEGITQRATGQTYRGEQTRITWANDKIVLPTIRGSAASSAIIKVSGITGRIRGLKHKRTDGSAIRPTLVLIDDPQTDESARSPSQCATRERILNGAVLGLAGPGQKIAGLMAMTVVSEGDLADRMLDTALHPEWRGERTAMLTSLPTNEEAWEIYAEVRRAEQRGECDKGSATAHYKKHREILDAGALAAWPERYAPGEISAIQHAMNLRIDRGDTAFFSEYQNDPRPEEGDDDEDMRITAEDIVRRVNGYSRCVIPRDATVLTAGVDVQKRCHYYMVIAWRSDFSGYIVDYGVWPDQGIPIGQHFYQKDVRRTLARVAAKQGLKVGIEGAIHMGLEQLWESILSKPYRVDGGGEHVLDRCIIDANWAQSSDAVYKFCRALRTSARVTPSHGRYIGPASLPLNQYTRRRGDKRGLNWRMPAAKAGRGIRHIVYDTNWWKSFFRQRLVTNTADKGSVTLYGSRPEDHVHVADHFLAEIVTQTTGRGRVVDEWALRKVGVENHWLDCAIMATVAASVENVQLPHLIEEPKRASRIRLSDLRTLRGTQA